MKESAVSALSSAATAIGATAGSAGSVHASKVAQQLQEHVHQQQASPEEEECAEAAGASHTAAEQDQHG